MNMPQPPVMPSEASTGSITTQIAEQMRQVYNLTNDPDDQLLLGMAEEVDHQADMYMATVDPGMRSQISFRRAALLKDLLKAVMERQKLRTAHSEARIAAGVLNKVSVAMLNIGLSADQIRLVVQGTVDLLSSEPKKPKKKAS